MTGGNRTYILVCACRAAVHCSHARKMCRRLRAHHWAGWAGAAGAGAPGGTHHLQTAHDTHEAVSASTTTRLTVQVIKLKSIAYPSPVPSCRGPPQISRHRHAATKPRAHHTSQTRGPYTRIQHPTPRLAGPIHLRTPRPPAARSSRTAWWRTSRSCTCTARSWGC